MSSDELEFINEMLRSMSFSSMTLEEQRAAVEASIAAVPASTTIEPIDAHGVPCEWISTAASRSDRTVVSIRGGGYCLGSLASNRHFSALLAGVASVRVLNVGYGSAPEHPYPSALNDVIDAYRWLLDGGTDPSTVMFAGNSAGGGLVLASLLALRDRGFPLPRGAVAISPWTDLANTGESMVSNAASEVMLDPAGVGDTAALYAREEQLRDPYVSPLYGDPTGLPPLLLQASTVEILRDDAVRFAARASRAGVDVELELVDGVPHVWHLFAGVLPEADDALGHIRSWIDARFGATAQ